MSFGCCIGDLVLEGVRLGYSYRISWKIKDVDFWGVFNLAWGLHEEISEKNKRR